MTRCKTTPLSRASLLCLIGGALLFVAACGEGNSPTPTAPTPTPAPAPAPPPPPPPPPAPVTSVVAEGSGKLPTLNLASVPFNTTATGTIGVTTKPERLSVPNLAAGPYTLYIGNFGPTDESVSFQITLTSVPGASVASTQSSRFGAVKGSLIGVTSVD